MIPDAASAAQRLQIRDDSDVVVARRVVRTLGAAQGLSQRGVEALALAVSEIARNIIVHAHSGELSFATVERLGRRGVTITAQDAGPGITDLDRAMGDGYSTGRGLGLGLPSAKRLVDEFEIVSSAEAGTRIVLTVWAENVG